MRLKDILYLYFFQAVSATEEVSNTGENNGVASEETPVNNMMLYLFFLHIIDRFISH